MLTLAEGEEEYLFREWLKSLTESAAETDTLTGSSLRELDEPGLFSQGSTLVFRKDQLGAEEKLLELLSESLPEEGHLIIRSRNVNENTKLFNFIRKNGEVKRFGRLGSGEFEQFLRKKAAERGLSIRPGTPLWNHMKERMCYADGNTDLFQVDGWIEMLSFTETVTEEDIDSFVSVTSEQGAFELLRLLSSGKTELFMRGMSRYDGEELMCLGTFAWAFRLAVKLKSFTEQEIGCQGQRSRLGRIAGLSAADAEKAYAEICRGTELIKNGYPKHEALMHTASVLASMVS